MRSGAAATPGSGEGSGGFRSLPVADGWWGSGGFQCRWLMRFRRVPAQMADKVPEGSGADGWWSSWRFRCRWLMKFPFWCRLLMRFRRVPGQKADEVPDGSGADSTQGSWCRWLMRFIVDEVPEGSGADCRQGSGGFRCRWLMRLRRVPVQKADEVPDGSDADSRQSCGGFRCRWLMDSGGFRYKHFPRSSMLLGITHEFIFLRKGVLFHHYLLVPPGSGSGSGSGACLSFLCYIFLRTGASNESLILWITAMPFQIRHWYSLLSSFS